MRFWHTVRGRKNWMHFSCAKLLNNATNPYHVTLNVFTLYFELDHQEQNGIEIASPTWHLGRVNKDFTYMCSSQDLHTWFFVSTDIACRSRVTKNQTTQQVTYVPLQPSSLTLNNLEQNSNDDNEYNKQRQYWIIKLLSINAYSNNTSHLNSTENISRNATARSALINKTKYLRVRIT